MQTKMQLTKSLTLESEQAIDFLKKISELLKNQRRHFDDAVVTHCIRLINDYVDENARDAAPGQQSAITGSGRRS
jgi:DNA polymerase/3'-5' exonuclease PolX